MKTLFFILALSIIAYFPDINAEDTFDCQFKNSKYSFIDIEKFGKWNTESGDSAIFTFK